jgi:hypothetical protein
MADDSEDESPTVVKTYVPAYQREEWDERADELGMSRSEFVKAMVQAGKRGFEGREPPDQSPENAPPTTNTESSTIEATVLDVLSTEGYLGWSELVDEVSGDLENRLEDTLQDLQSRDRVRYSGRHGGYTVEE